MKRFLDLLEYTGLNAPIGEQYELAGPSVAHAVTLKGVKPRDSPRRSGSEITSCDARVNAARRSFDRGTLSAILYEYLAALIDRNPHAVPWAPRVRYSENELCVMTSGRVVLESASGERCAFGPGDAFVVPAGFVGTWEVIEDCSKIYAIFESRD